MLLQERVLVAGVDCCPPCLVGVVKLLGSRFLLDNV